MELPPAPWENGANSLPGMKGASPLLLPLVTSLQSQRKARDIGLRLRKGLTDAQAEYTYLRVQGLQELSWVLEASSREEDWASLFRESQMYEDMQVVPVLLQNSLGPQAELARAAAGKPTGTRWHPSSDEELIKALRVVEGCWIIDSASRDCASQYGGLEALLSRVGSEKYSTDVKMGCLDALVALLLDNSPGVEEFNKKDGVLRLIEILRSPKSALSLRLKAAEVLLLLINQVLATASLSNATGSPSVRDQAVKTLASSIGPAAANVITNFDPAAISSAQNLKTHAQRVLEVMI